MLPKRGMGGIMQQTQNSGQVTQEEASLHINILELKAVRFALKSFAKVYQMTNAHVRFKIDNTHAQAYVNLQGETKSVGLCNQAQELWKWCLLHQTIVSAEIRKRAFEHSFSIDAHLAISRTFMTID